MELYNADPASLMVLISAQVTLQTTGQHPAAGNIDL